MSLQIQQKNNGFTLIEMLVALSLFTIVVTIVAGSLLVLIDGNKQLQGEQSVMTNLSFAMDSMTREIRTGSKYLCWESNFPGIFSDQEGKNFSDCTLGNNNNKKYQGVSFVETGSSITGTGAFRIAYFYDSINKTINRRVGNNATAQSIVSNGISIDRAEFFVTGSSPFGMNEDINQPTVTIVIEASETGAAGEKPYVLQTTITQRELDL